MAGVAGADDEGRQFNNASIRGNYGFALSGRAYVPVSATPPFALFDVVAVGQFRADGSGNITNASRTLNINGQISPQTFTCTYLVQPNGTGSAVCSVIETGITETFSFTLNSQTKEIQFIATNAGAIISGIAKKQ